MSRYLVERRMPGNHELVTEVEPIGACRTIVERNAEVR
jgi:hypothetical protein